MEFKLPSDLTVFSKPVGNSHIARFQGKIANPPAAFGDSTPFIRVFLFKCAPCCKDAVLDMHRPQYLRSRAKISLPRHNRPMEIAPAISHLNRCAGLGGLDIDAAFPEKVAVSDENCTLPCVKKGGGEKRVIVPNLQSCGFSALNNDVGVKYIATANLHFSGNQQGPRVKYRVSVIRKCKRLLD